MVIHDKMKEDSVQPIKWQGSVGVLYKDNYDFWQYEVFLTNPKSFNTFLEETARGRDLPIVSLTTLKYMFIYERSKTHVNITCETVATYLRSFALVIMFGCCRLAACATACIQSHPLTDCILFLGRANK